MPIRIVDEAEVDEELDRAIKAGLCESFPDYRDVFARTRAWHGSTPSWTVVLEEEERVVAHAGVVDRVIRVDAQDVRVAGIENVFVLPARRGCGLSARVLKIAMDEALRRGADCGLLFCIPEIEKVYARAEWRTVPPVPITRITETGEAADLPPPNVAMYFPLVKNAFPPGPIHLNGNDW